MTSASFAPSPGCRGGGGGGGGDEVVDGDWVLHKHITNLADILHLLPDIIQLLASSLVSSHRFSRQSGQAVSWKYE